MDTENQSKIYLTKEGLKKLQKEYESLEKIRLAKIKSDAPKAWQSEDLNSEYLSFQEDLSFFETRIQKLEYVLKNAEIIKAPPKDMKDVVGIGATVTLRDDDGQINEFMIVSAFEANPGEGKISSDSPVGKALLGRKIEEETLITSPISVRYKIKKIKYQIS